MHEIMDRERKEEKLRGRGANFKGMSGRKKVHRTNKVIDGGMRRRC